MRFCFVRSAVTVCVWLAAGPALAQGFGSREGPGVRLGEGLVLHPALGVGAGFDNNIFFEDSSEDPDSAPLLRFQGGLKLATESAARGGKAPGRKVDFLLGLGGGFLNFLSDKTVVTDQNDFDLNGDLLLAINPEGAVGFTIKDQFSRVAIPAPYELPEPLALVNNRGGAAVTFRPGGRALEIGVGYTHALSVYQEQPAQRTPGYDPGRMWHIGAVNATWRPLPLTAWNLDVEARLYQQQDDSNADGAAPWDPAPVAPGPQLVDSTWVRAFVGLTTALTPKMSLILQPGFAMGNYDPRDADPLVDDEDYTNFLLNAELGWRLAPRSRIALGYRRDADDSVIANFYVDDAIRLRLAQGLGSRVDLSLAPTLRLRTYQGLIPDARSSQSVPGVVADVTRNDTIVEAPAELALRVSDWIYLVGSYSLILTDTDHEIAFAASDTPAPSKFTKHVALLRIDAVY